MREKGSDVFSTAAAYMEEHLFDRLRVEDVARHCAISPSGLEKNFAKYANVGVMRYFLDLRLKYAAGMLKKGYSVKYLTELLNFSSSAHLSMAFKKKYKVSPLEHKHQSIE